jgi:hypothetical protein
MEWKQCAVWLAIPAVTFVWFDAARPPYEDTMTCYVALANDITPLVDPGLPDSAAASAECTAQKRIGADADIRREHDQIVPIGSPAIRAANGVRNATPKI